MSTTEQRVAIVTGAARGIGAATAVRLAAEGRSVAVLDLDEAACKDTVEKITAAGGTALAVGCDVSDSRPGGSGRRAGRRRAGRADDPREQRGRAPRQPAVQDERVRLGPRDERAPQGRVPDGEGRPGPHGRGQVRPDRLALLLVGPRQPGAGQLLRGQGGAPGPHQDARQGAGQVRRHRQRRRARLHRHGDDRADGRPCRHGLRGVPGGGRHPDPGPARRPSRGRRERHRLLRGRRRGLRLRPGHVRGRMDPSTDPKGSGTS